MAASAFFVELLGVQQLSSHERCAVCDSVPALNHFGGRSCRACAAFFRRTIAMRKVYVCRNAKQCTTRKSTKKLICKYCRFTACLREGMQVEDVQAFYMPITEAGSSTLSNAIKAWRWSFLLRRSTLSEIHGSQEKALTMVNRVRTGQTLVRALLAETKVFLHFMQCTRLSERLNDVDEIDLARALFLRWTGFENMRQIVRNMGFRNKVVYYADESVVKCDEEGLTNYYRTYNALREPDLIARHAHKYFSETVFRYAQLLYDAKLDETEMVAFLMLHMLRFATKKFDVHEQARDLSSEVLRGLDEHYRTTYNDVSIRMATVVLLLDESEKAAHRWEEQNVMLRLSGQEPVADFFEAVASPATGNQSVQPRKYYLGAICLDE